MFLVEIINKQSDIQIDMACQVFDEITKYYSENRCHYMGWKSNDRHRTLGFKIKCSRFILPMSKDYNNRIDYRAREKLADFDKVFTMLDGKSEVKNGLCGADRKSTRLNSSH